MSAKDDSIMKKYLDLEIKSVLLDIQWLKDEIELKQNHLLILRAQRKG